ncbi:hypothetical protein RclHR1_28430001 [Rhizophagus clarus]|uniref:Uncharacterized protein n=1 Tax=Rhizophagus clarus TaxID=94130 RepID=A0A2Z6R7F5_9GLOM|nr:hypothetical protein RclHR1_28430001 [Rhizophagus clarus]GES89383.1 hypothetical protein RCL_jg27013.t1 [Rhizophagus clarus]
MFTNQSNFSLINKKDKAYKVALHFHNYDEFISILPERKKNNNTGKLKNIIIVSFNFKEDFIKVLNTTYIRKTLKKNESGNKSIEITEFKFNTNYKEPITPLPEQKEHEKGHIIQVFDIPLYLTKNVIRNTFSIH